MVDCVIVAEGVVSWVPAMFWTADSSRFDRAIRSRFCVACRTSACEPWSLRRPTSYYGLRDYGHPGQIGLERTPEEYVARMVEVFREVRRVLAADGTLWLNLGDSYAGSGPSGASYQSETTKRRAAGDGTPDHNGNVMRTSRGPLFGGELVATIANRCRSNGAGMALRRDKPDLPLNRRIRADSYRSPNGKPCRPRIRTTPRGTEPRNCKEHTQPEPARVPNRLEAGVVKEHGGVAEIVRFPPIAKPRCRKSDDFRLF